jgi:hypothetical protein
LALRIGIEWVDLEVYRLVVGLKDVAGLGKTSFVKFFGFLTPGAWKSLIRSIMLRYYASHA